MRIKVALALIPLLATFTNDELAMIDFAVSEEFVPPQVAQFKDRIPETKAVCGFLTKVAALALPALPS